MAIREGAWDCPHCGRKRNRGPEKYCGGCGAPRGDDVPFYLPEDAAEVTDAEALKRAQAGPDWTCAFCKADNPSDHAFCSGCGAPRDGATARPVVEHRNDAAPPPAPAAPANPRLKRGCQLGCLGLLALVALIWFLGRPRAATLTVSGLRWERTVAVEELRTVEEQGWEGELPAGARTLSTRREVHHTNRVQIGSETRTRTVTERVQTGTEKVKVGTRDLGNGYFEDVYEDRPVYENRERQETYQEPVYREDPVYGVRHTYLIDKWVPVPERQAKAAAGDGSPRWPDPGLRRNERAGQRTELYEVLFEDRDGAGKAGKVYRARDEADWKRFEPGAAWRVKVQGGGKVVEILGPA